MPFSPPPPRFRTAHGEAVYSVVSTPPTDRPTDTTLPPVRPSIRAPVLTLSMCTHFSPPLAGIGSRARRRAHQLVKDRMPASGTDRDRDRDTDRQRDRERGAKAEETGRLGQVQWERVGTPVPRPSPLQLQAPPRSPPRSPRSPSPSPPPPLTNAARRGSAAGPRHLSRHGAHVWSCMKWVASTLHVNSELMAQYERKVARQRTEHGLAWDASDRSVDRSGGSVAHSDGPRYLCYRMATADSAGGVGLRQAAFATFDAWLVRRTFGFWKAEAAFGLEVVEAAVGVMDRLKLSRAIRRLVIWRDSSLISKAAAYESKATVYHTMRQKQLCIDQWRTRAVALRREHSKALVGMSYYISRTLRSGLAAIGRNAGFELVSDGQGGFIQRQGGTERYGTHGRHAKLHQEELVKLCDTFYREKVLRESVGAWTRRARCKRVASDLDHRTKLRQVASIFAQMATSARLRREKEVRMPDRPNRTRTHARACALGTTTPDYPN